MIGDDFSAIGKATEDTIMVSVLCNTYNHGEFIKDALEGFLMQKTSFRFEVLVHDDASTDNTPDIIRAYAEKYPDLIFPLLQNENQQNRGIMILREIQFQRARGKYIALCEGDDYWIDPGKLQRQVDFLEQHPDYMLCFHSAITLASNNPKTYAGKFENLGDRDYTGEEVLRKWTVPFASMVFRREAIPFLRVLSNARKYLFWDIQMILSLAELGKMRCFNQAMSVYRVHGKGMHQVLDTAHHTLMFRHYQAITSDFNGRYRRMMFPFLSESALVAAKELFRNCMPMAGFRYSLLAVKYLLLTFITEPQRVIHRMIR